jgi:hypothetical protein
MVASAKNANRTASFVAAIAGFSAAIDRSRYPGHTSPPSG